MFKLLTAASSALQSGGPERGCYGWGAGDPSGADLLSTDGQVVSNSSSARPCPSPGSPAAGRGPR